MLTFRSQLSSELQSGRLTVCYYQNYSHIIKCNDYQAIFLKNYQHVFTDIDIPLTVYNHFWSFPSVLSPPPFQPFAVPNF